MRKDLTSQDRFIQNLTTSNRIGTLGLGLNNQKIENVVERPFVRLN